MKIFRKFRQELIQKGNVRKYFLYAIGEILLVMIGILLAFQVNSWNDNRIKRNAELTFYKNIKDQIKNDKDNIQGQINYNTFYMGQFKYANEIIELNDRTKTDTLGKIAVNLSNYSDFDRQGNIYETMVNSGEIKLLHNHLIIKGIRELEERYLYINRIENIHYDVILTYAIPSINSTVKFSTGEVQYPDKLYTFEFQNVISALLSVMNEKDQIYRGTKDEIEIIIELLDKELNFDLD
jgi:hypothetical protein